MGDETKVELAVTGAAVRGRGRHVFTASALHGDVKIEVGQTSPLYFHLFQLLTREGAPVVITLRALRDEELAPAQPNEAKP